MASATDLITYIGVPLTVAGVIPLLWNMFKGLRIRYKLSRSIPWEFRPFFSLITDPAAGTVTVVAKIPTLVNDTLWKTREADEPLESHQNIAWRFKARRHRMIFQLFELGPKLLLDCGFWPFRDRGSWAWSFLVGSSNALDSRPCSGPTFDGEFTVRRGSLLLYPWITICLTYNFDLSLSRAPDELDYYEDSGGSGEVRFKVDSDMGTKPVPMAMTWTQFVWLALGLGVDLRDPGFQLNFPRFLNSSGTVLMHASDIDDRWTVRLITGIHNRFILRRALAWANVMVLRHDRSYFYHKLGDQSSHPLESFNFPTQERPRDASQTDNGTDMDVDPKDFYSGTLSALVWLFYRLDALKPRQYLYGYGVSITTGPYYIPVSWKLQECRLRSLCQLKELDLNGHLEQIVTTLFTTAYPYSLMPHVVTATQILQRLREAFELSKYVSGSYKTVESLEYIDKRLRDAINEVAGIDLGRALQITNSKMEDCLKAVRSSLTSVLKEQSKHTPHIFTNAYPDLDSFANIKAYQSKLDPHMTETFDPDSVKEDEGHDSEFLPHILLGMSDWKEDLNASWGIDKDLDKHLTELETLIANFGGEIIDSEDAVGRARVSVQQAIECCYEGAFSAPSSQNILRKILNKTKRVVYLQ